MRVKTGKPITFRPSQQIRDTLDSAQRVGISMTDLINDVLESSIQRHFRRHVKRQIAKVSKAQREIKLLTHRRAA